MLRLLFSFCNDLFSPQSKEYNMVKNDTFLPFSDTKPLFCKIYISPMKVGFSQNKILLLKKCYKQYFSYLQLVTK